MNVDYPRIPPATLRTLQPDGKGTIAARNLVKAYLARSQWIAARRSCASGMWARGANADGVATATLLPGSIDYGTFLLPPPGSATQQIEVALYISSYAGGATLTYYATAFAWNPRTGGWGDPLSRPTAISTPNSTGWKTETLKLRQSPKGPFWLQITGSQSTASTQTLATIVVSIQTSSTVPDGETAPESYQKLAAAHVGGDDRPLDAYTLRTISRNLNCVAGRYPQGLASHSLVSGSPAAGANCDLHYRIHQGPITRGVTVWVYATQVDASNNPVAGATSAGYVDDDGFAGASDGSETLLNNFAWRSFTLAAGLFTANTRHSLALRLSPSDPAYAIRLHDVAIYETEPAAETNYLINSTNRVDTKAERLWTANTSGSVFGPIVGSYAQRTARLASWGDRATLWRNSVYLARYTLATYVADRIRWAESVSLGGGAKATDFEDVASSAAFSSPQVLARAKQRTTRGARRVGVYLMARRVGMADPERVAKLQIYKDGAATSLVYRIRRETPHSEWPLDKRFAKLGSLAVTPGTVHDLDVRAGFVDALDVSTSGNADLVRLDGVLFLEGPVGDSVAALYYYAQLTDLSAAIPDNDIVTGTSQTLAVAAYRDFTVRMVRVRVVVTHSAPTQLRYKLTSPAATAVTFRASGHAGDTSAWWSDSTGGIAGDATPDAVLSAFAGESSAGTWTLTVYDDAAGTTGTLDTFALELW